MNWSSRNGSELLKGPAILKACTLIFISARLFFYFILIIARIRRDVYVVNARAREAIGFHVI